MTNNILRGKEERNYLAQSSAHTSQYVYSGKLKPIDGTQKKFNVLYKDYLSILEPIIEDDEVFLEARQGISYNSKSDKKAFVDFSSFDWTINLIHESNFFGNILSVEVRGPNNWGADSFFNLSGKSLKLVEAKRFKLLIKNLNNPENFYLFEPSEELPFPPEAKKLNHEEIRPIFINDLRLFTTQFTRNLSIRLPELLDVFVKKEHERWLELEWIENLSNRALWMIGSMDLFVQHSYDTLNKNIESLRAIRDLHEKICLSDPEKSPLTMFQHRDLVKNIELIEAINQGIESRDFYAKCLNLEWIKLHHYTESVYLNTNDDIFKEYPAFKDFDYKIMNEIDGFEAAHHIAHLLPDETNFGKQYSYVHGTSTDKKIAIRSKTGLKDASLFWVNYAPNHILRFGYGLNEFDCPASFDEVEIFLNMFSENEVSDKDLVELTSSVSNEIEQDARYIMHPDVTFDLRNEIFPTVTINQCDRNSSDYHCVFRSKDSKFFKLIFHLNDGTAVINSHSFIAENLKHQSNQLAFYCITLIRDFMVAENREVIFSSKTRKQTIGNPKYDHSLKIIYVPRIRYLYSSNEKDLKKVYEENFPFRPKTLHSVKSHFRLLNDNQRPSNTAILLARKYNCEIPVGFTFVKDHERGGLSEEQKVIYRSRSMLKTFYGLKETKPQKNDWFEFEKDIEKLLSRSCKEVMRRQASHDGGIDVEAIDHDGNVLLAQCKCYAPNRKIDRKYVDELYGSITRFKNENGLDHVHGIIFTTSSFSKDAIEAANALEIELVSGHDLKKLMDDEGL